jgi:hypothetical protein
LIHVPVLFYIDVVSDGPSLLISSAVQTAAVYLVLFFCCCRPHDSNTSFISASKPQPFVARFGWWPAVNDHTSPCCFSQAVTMPGLHPAPVSCL